MTSWSCTNSYFLALLSLSYVVGEIAHFLINTTSRAVALDIHFGDVACYKNISVSVEENAEDCHELKNKTSCLAVAHCEWNYNGLGIQYQILSGPSFVAVFTVTGIIAGVLADKFKTWGRNKIMALGTILFSTCCLLMGISNSYWQLVVLRMGIAAGEGVCRPIASGLIPDLFSPGSRGVANGIFSWGIYFGYGLAYVIGIYVTQADILGFGWRASYVIPALPGLIFGALLFLSVQDPFQKLQLHQENSADVEEETRALDRTDQEVEINNSTNQEEETQPEENLGALQFLKEFLKSFCTLPMLLLLLAACFRQLGGLCWAFNTRPYFQTFHPDFNLGLWVFACSIIGGSFGVFFGGFASDRLATRLGLHSRLWVLAASQILASPLALATLYFDPPYAFVGLMFYYLCAETWFAILFTVIVEICSPQFKSTSIALFIFIMNNTGGNLPVIVDPISKSFGYSTAVYLVWPGCIALSGVLFFVASLPLMRRRQV